MKLSNTALGLAMVCAGLLAVRALLGRHQPAGRPAPPTPEQLIGRPQARLSATHEAAAFAGSKAPPM